MAESTVVFISALASASTKCTDRQYVQYVYNPMADRWQPSLEKVAAFV